MSDWLVFGVMVGATYAISKALKPGKPPAKPPRKITRSTTRPRTTHAPTLPPTPTTRTQWPERVPVDTSYVEPATTPQKQAIAPRQKRARRHTGSGPFGANQQILKAAQKSAFKWHVGPDEYDEDCGNGWIEGLSEDEPTDSGRAEDLETAP